MPATSGSPTQIATSQPTKAALSNTPADQFQSGDLGYVQEELTAGNCPLYALVSTGGPAVDGLLVLSVYQNTSARWVSLSALVDALTLTVANLAALAALNGLEYPSGQVVNVQTLRSAGYFTLDKNSTATPDGILVVAALNSGGNWVRQQNIGRSWLYQVQWYVDPAAGNDENTGATNVTALRTVAELSRRLQLLIQGTAYTIDLLGNIPSTDRMNWTPTFVGPAPAVTVFSQRGTITFRGVQTVSRAGTLTAATQTTTSAQASATDGATVWTADIGKLLVMTGGAQAGETCWIAADLGAGTARVSSWVTSAGTAVGVVPALSTYNIVNLTTWACEMTFLAPNDGCLVTFQDIEVVPPANAAFYLIFGGASFRPIRSKFNPSANISGPFGSTSSYVIRSSCFTSSNGTAASPRSMQLSGTTNPAFIISAGCLVLNYEIEVLTGAQYRPADTLHQGTRVQLANSGSGAVIAGYASFSGNCGFFDWDRNAAALGRDAAISVEGNGFVGISGFVFGTTAAASTYGVRVEAGGQMLVASQTSTGPLAAITVAGSAAAIRFDDPGIGAAVGTAIPPLTGGAVTPAASALTSWANWAAAPFNSYVMSYRTGARIYING